MDAIVTYSSMVSVAKITEDKFVASIHVRIIEYIMVLVNISWFCWNLIEITLHVVVSRPTNV